jgi:L-lactate permease
VPLRRPPWDSIRRVLILALSEAAKTTITYVAIWFVIFPAIVTGLIVFAIVQALGEARENRERWTSRRR